MTFKIQESRRSGGKIHPRYQAWVVAVLLVGAVGCGPAGELEEELGSMEQEFIVANGLNLNGLNLNGLNLNGLNLNGLNLNGLSTQSFQDWYNLEPALHAHVMNYIVECAVAEGESRTYTDPTTGLTHTWNGLLGLAPGWASGLAATTVELQVVSACLAAHANKYDIHVTISLLGRNALGVPIPYTSQELASYDVKEACFFGNLFDGGTGTFSANDGFTLASNQSTPRVCGLPGAGGASQCSPIVFVGSCAQYCTRDITGLYYTSCTYGGVTYQPITTRISNQDVYTCGDGVCQATERCGTGTTPDSCAADCGAC
jgi:hypothetical protein